MFLATTALSEFWERDQQILFLSSGCLRYDKRSEWESLQYQVLPCPWDDWGRFCEAVRYLDEYYERILHQLAVYLNTVHHVSYGMRYWRILIGPWLIHYLHALYDRYVQMTDAFSKFPGLQTKMLDPRSFKTPTDTWEYVNLITDDPLNLQLYTQVLQAMGYSFPLGTLRDGWPELEDETGGGTKMWMRVSKKVRNWGFYLAEGLVMRALDAKRQVVMCDIYLPHSQTWELARQTGFRAVPIGLRNVWPFQIPEPASDPRRNDLAALGADDEFKRLFVKTLPQNFPTVYLEGFDQAKSHISKRYSKVPPVAVSLVGWHFNEPFKFLAGEVAEKGGRLVASQHGGGYGDLLFLPHERHEAQLADRYMVWGWADKGVPLYRNLPSPKLSSHLPSRSRKSGSHSTGPALLVLTSCSRYLSVFASVPVAGQFEDYIDWELRFLSAVPEQIRHAILVRPFMSDNGWAIRQRISDRFANIHWDSGQTFHQALQRSRIVIHNHPGTTFLETMAANVPTIAFWNPHRWKMREAAESYYDRLRDAGILWDSPEDAAAKIAAVYEDPWKWWDSEPVVRTRQEFVNRYAFARKNWASCWAKALQQELSLSRISG